MSTPPPPPVPNPPPTPASSSGLPKGCVTALIVAVVTLVAITFLAILASLAVPTFNVIQQKAQEQKAKKELAADLANPLTDEEKAKLWDFGIEVGAMVTESRLDEVNALTDFDALTERSFDGLTVPGLAAEKRGFKRSVSTKGVFHDMIGGDLSPMLVHERDGVPAVRMRILPEDGGVNYVDILVRRDGDSFKVIDMYAYMFGAMTSMEAKLLMAAMMAKDDNAILGNLLGVRTEQAKEIETALGILNQKVQEGDLDGVRQHYLSLDPELQKVRIFFMRYFLAVQAMQTEDVTPELEAEYRDAIHKAPEVLGKDSTTDLLLVDAYVMEGKWDESIAAIDSVMKVVGEDPYLNVLKGNLFMQQKKLADVGRCIALVEAAEPDLVSLIDLKLDFYAEKGDFAALADVLRAFAGRFGMKLTAEDLNAPQYEAFLKSPEFAAYSKEPLE